jgi:hypothetical protein
VLVVGDGDFSFSLAFANLLQGTGMLVATSFDSRANIEAKYPDSHANIVALEGASHSLCLCLTKPPRP